MGVIVPRKVCRPFRAQERGGGYQGLASLAPGNGLATLRVAAGGDFVHVHQTVQAAQVGRVT